MNEMNVCNNEIIEEAVEVAEKVTKNTGLKDAALIGGGAIGALIIMKICDAFKKRKAKNDEKIEKPVEDELEDLPPIEDSAE